MKCIRRIKSFCNRCSNECKRINIKVGLLVGALLALIAIFVWSFGNNTHKILAIYTFPKFALPLMFMYIIWAMIYFMLGITVFAVLFNCESYKRYFSQKIAFLLIMSVLFSYFSYLLFFSANAPLLTFIMYLITIVFAILSFVECKKIYILWSIVVMLYIFWLIYNAIISLSFLIIN